jgi:hypothetical protein
MDNPATVADDLTAYLNFYIANTGQAVAFDEVAPMADAVCTYYQGVAIMELLLDAEVDTLFHHMIRSARTRRWLLTRAKGAGATHKLLKASNTRGLFAALVAADWSLAGEIAALSSRAWQERFEYEDDFWYAHFLHRFIAGDDPGTLTSVLAEYARALDGDEPARLQLCRALLAVNQELASDAFEQLLLDRKEQLDEMRATSILATDDLFLPFSAVYVEGLAWLRLLERAGLRTSTEYPLCPSLARSEQRTPYVSLGFPD